MTLTKSNRVRRFAGEDERLAVQRDLDVLTGLARFDLDRFADVRVVADLQNVDQRQLGLSLRVAEREAVDAHHGRGRHLGGQVARQHGSAGAASSCRWRRAGPLASRSGLLGSCNSHCTSGSRLPGPAAEPVNDDDCARPQKCELADTALDGGVIVGLSELPAAAAHVPASLEKSMSPVSSLLLACRFFSKFLDRLEPLATHRPLGLAVQQQRVVVLGHLLRTAGLLVDRRIDGQQPVAVDRQTALVVMVVIAEVVGGAECDDGVPVVPTAPGDEVPALLVAGQEG